MELSALGLTAEFENFVREQNLGSFTLARVVAEHRERYLVKTEEKTLTAEVTGNLRYTARNRADFPAVGDWVAISVFDDSLAVIHRILPRKTLLERQAIGKFGEKQIIAANIDCAFIVLGADRDFNLNRMERFLAIVRAGGIRPVVLLSKIDLPDQAEVDAKIEMIRHRHPALELIPFSNITGAGIHEIESMLLPAHTFCFLGSSGVGKSTLSNRLSGQEVMKTRETSVSTSKGRHTTSHRELIVLEGGAIVIDTPGMREVGVTEQVDASFDRFEALARQCKFGNCTHQQETGCRILEALDAGEIDPDAYENYLKLQRESARFQTSVAEKRKKDKAFGKMYKQVVKHRKVPNIDHLPKVPDLESIRALCQYPWPSPELFPGLGCRCFPATVPSKLPQ